MGRRNFQVSQCNRSVATLLLIIFATYFVNITLFTHHHIVDGVTIVHSHFSTQEHKDDASSHSHTESELTLISTLSQFIAESQSSIQLPNVVVTEHHPILIEVEVVISSIEQCTLPQLRAPPTECFLS